jgi:hypothetical protein
MYHHRGGWLHGGGGWAPAATAAFFMGARGNKRERARAAENEKTAAVFVLQSERLFRSLFLSWARTTMRDVRSPWRGECSARR